MRAWTVALCASMAIVTASRAEAETLPTGIYIFEYATINSKPRGCLNASFNGHLINPGPGQIGTEVAFFSGVQDYTFDGFPPQPASGLTGWTDASPAKAFGRQTLGVPPVTTPEGKAGISFAIKRESPGTAVARIHIVLPGCNTTVTSAVALTGPIPSNY